MGHYGGKEGYDRDPEPSKPSRSAGYGGRVDRNFDRADRNSGRSKVDYGGKPGYDRESQKDDPVSQTGKQDAPADRFNSGGDQSDRRGGLDKQDAPASGFGSFDATSFGSFDGGDRAFPAPNVPSKQMVQASGRQAIERMGLASAGVALSPPAGAAGSTVDQTPLGPKAGAQALGDLSVLTQTQGPTGDAAKDFANVPESYTPQITRAQADDLKSDLSIEYIARMVEGEAGSEPLDGQRAVVDSVINRLAAQEQGVRGFGARSVQGILNAPDQYDAVNKRYRAGGGSGRVSQLPQARASTVDLVRNYVNERVAGTTTDLSKGATFYENPPASGPKMVRDQTTQIGQHLFGQRSKGGTLVDVDMLDLTKNPNTLAAIETLDLIAASGTTPPSGSAPDIMTPDTSQAVQMAQADAPDPTTTDPQIVEAARSSGVSESAITQASKALGLDPGRTAAALAGAAPQLGMVPSDPRLGAAVVSRQRLQSGGASPKNANEIVKAIVTAPHGTTVGQAIDKAFPWFGDSVKSALSSKGMDVSQDATETVSNIMASLTPEPQQPAPVSPVMAPPQAPPQAPPRVPQQPQVPGETIQMAFNDSQPAQTVDRPAPPGAATAAGMGAPRQVQESPVDPGGVMTNPAPVASPGLPVIERRMAGAMAPQPPPDLSQGNQAMAAAQEAAQRGTTNFQATQVVSQTAPGLRTPPMGPEPSLPASERRTAGAKAPGTPTVPNVGDFGIYAGQPYSFTPENAATGGPGGAFAKETPGGYPEGTIDISVTALPEIRKANDIAWGNLTGPNGSINAGPVVSEAVSSGVPPVDNLGQPIVKNHAAPTSMLGFTDTDLLTGDRKANAPLTFGRDEYWRDDGDRSDRDRPDLIPTPVSAPESASPSKQWYDMDDSELEGFCSSNSGHVVCYWLGQKKRYSKKYGMGS